MGRVVRVLAVAACFACASPAVTDPCQPLNIFLASSNISTLNSSSDSTNKSEEALCGADGWKCCGPGTVTALQLAAARDLSDLLRKHFQPAVDSLQSAATRLSDEIKELWSWSRSETLWQAGETGAGGAVATETLFNTLAGYLESVDPSEETGGSDAAPVVDPAAAVADYFAALFPGVYLGVVRVGGPGRAAPAYEECLRRQAAGRFGAVPDGLARAAAAALPPLRASLAATRLVTQVLSTADSTEASPECRAALTRLNRCPLCRGLSARPCSNYCLNVLRGCLSRRAALDLPWGALLQELEDTLRELLRDQDSSLQSFAHSVPTAVSDALIVARVEGPAIEKEMKRLCGSPKTDNSSFEPTSNVIPTPSSSTRNGTRAGSGWADAVRELAAAVRSAAARGLYSDLPDAVCADTHLVDPPPHCWNGHSVAEYSKAVVRPESDAQKYNPEVKWTKTLPDPSIRLLGDQLRSMKKAVGEAGARSRAAAPAAEALVSGEGSGSGAGPGRDDEDDYSWSGSGSGDGGYDVVPRTGLRGNKPVVVVSDVSNAVSDEEPVTGAPPRTSGGSSVSAAFFIVLAVTAAATSLSL